MGLWTREQEPGRAIQLLPSDMRRAALQRRGGIVSCWSRGTVQGTTVQAGGRMWLGSWLVLEVRAPVMGRVQADAEFKQRGILTSCGHRKFTSLCFNFFIYKIRIIIATLYSGWEDLMN